MDSNDRFHYDGSRLLYEHTEVFENCFFCIDNKSYPVESVSAIVGENGSGKTSFVSLLNYIFVQGRPYPKYICICRIDGEYIGFSNLENTPNDCQIKASLKEHWDFRSKTLHRDSEGCPFNVLYYSPYLHTKFVWDNRNCWCHDISVVGSLNASVGKVMDAYFNRQFQDVAKKNRLPDSPIECMDQSLNVARIEFLYRYSALPEEKRKDVPFPLSLAIEIKPNIDLFLEFEGYLHRLTENNIGRPDIKENIDEIRRIEGCYTTKEPFRCLLIAFTIYMVQTLEYEKLGFTKCPDVRDLIDFCVAKLGCNDVVRAIEGGWAHGGRIVDANRWMYIDKKILVDFLLLWSQLDSKQIGRTMGSGIKISAQDADAKAGIIRLLYLHEKLTLGKGRFLAVDPLAMSSGECAYLNMFALLYDRIHAMLSPVKRSLLLAVDEAETTLHPEWQRQMVYNLIWFFENFAQECSVHIVFMTHSPMLLSDIPIGNCVFLYRDKDKGVTVVKDIAGSTDGRLFTNTFGANIFDMYYHPFFMTDGTIGKFALRKIENAFANKNTDGARIARLTGDPFLRGLLQDEFGAEEGSEDVIPNRELEYEPDINYPKE